jgi:pilus assembly protein Flp/PilA
MLPAGTAHFFQVKRSIMITRFLRDETGLELSEYAIAAALITIATVTAFLLVGTSIASRIETLAGFIP